MDKGYATAIARLISTWAANPSSQYRLEEERTGELAGFHEWADERPCEGAFLIRDRSDHRLWILLIDWRCDGDFFVTLFPESRIGPIAEIHKLIIEETPTEAELHWRYKPTKRDGLNQKRKEYFRRAFLSLEVRISVPNTAKEVEDFIEELFALASARTAADELPSGEPIERNSFPEGKRVERRHISRERNGELIRQAKNIALERDGHLKCACCGFDFFKIYGILGRGFIEAHHTKPVSTLHENGEEVRVDDLALVCSNCHRMLHRRRPWLEMENLRQLMEDAHEVPL